MMNTSEPVLLTTPRRIHERKLLEIEVSLESDHNFFMGLTENISEGGLFIATHSLREVGTEIDLELHLPNVSEKIQARAVVRWLRLYNDHSDTPPGMGLQFLQLPSFAAFAIRDFVHCREALFWEE
jgi:uncharacterized protein (TIGR02266 family)